MPVQYRAEHVGSFLRPARLLSARQDVSIAKEKLRDIEDVEILKVLAKQKELGFEIFTDGELRRNNFMSDFIDAVEGFDMEDNVLRSWNDSLGRDTTPVSRVAGIVTSKLHQIRPLTGHELSFLREHSPGSIKVTIPSPTQFPAISYKRGITDHVYGTYSDLLWDIVEIMKGEMKRLSKEGINYIQIDAPRYSYFMDPKWRAWIKTEMGSDPDALLDEYIRADNACFDSARRSGITLAIHLCRGNNRSHWYAEGGYDSIAEKMFRSIHADRFLLEYDDSRSGTFEPLRFVPKDKTIVLGLVSSKRPELEESNQLKDRINEATRYFPLENLALSPQCGFASTMEGNLLTEEEQWAKLKLVVDTAREVWGTS
jgi:5-methyltetrahydropteroyltriglutamate--homocysteine methyltransferase